MDKKIVLIVGAGYAGLSLAQILDKNQSIQLIIVEPREFFLHKWSTLRSAVKGGKWVNRSLVPTKQTLKNTKWIRAKVTKIEEKEKVVFLDSGEQVSFDFIVLTIGARNLSPAEPPISATSLEDTKKFFDDMRGAIEKAKNICVYGAGIVGLELVGEILDEYPEKIVSMILPKGHKFVATTPLSPYQEKSLKKLLKSHQVRFLENDLIVNPEIPKELGLVDSPLIPVPEGKVQLGSGRKLECELIILCLGGRLATLDVIPNAWLSMSTGEVKVDKFFRVSACEYAFSFGDVAALPHAKLGYIHQSNAKAVAKNIESVLVGKEPKEAVKKYSQNIVISFGSSDGRMLLDEKKAWGGFITKMIKSKGLFTSMIWSMYAGGLKPPK